jgi:glycosyltransferase involved in cell wall biosynthesis
MRVGMNILVITPGFLPTIGGAEIGVHEIYTRLGTRHQVTILTKSPRRPSPSAEGFEQGNYTVSYYRDFLNLGNIRGKMLLRGSIPPFSVGALYGANRHIHKVRPDVVNVHYAAYIGLAGVWAQKVHQVPTVLSLIGRDAVPGPLVPKLWPWYSNLVARQVAHTVFISKFCQSYHREACFPYSIIPYGVDTTKIAPGLPDESLREKLGLAPDVRILFSLQRLSLLKRVDIAIHSVSRLVDQGITNFVLLVGGTGQEADRLKQLVERLRVQQHVKFLGLVPEHQVGRYFALADIFVFPSMFETFGIAATQAMAAGVPVIATRNSAIPEVVEDGVTGLLSPPLDAEAMAQNVATLLNNKELRQRMGQQARERAVRLYDWERVALRYESVLQDVVQTYGSHG